jgi:hypothetical protein
VLPPFVGVAVKVIDVPLQSELLDALDVITTLGVT